MKIAYLCEPQLGGTFTFFLRLRPALAERGIDLRCVSAMSPIAVRGTPYEEIEGCNYVGIDDDLPQATEALIAHLLTERYDLVMVLPGGDILSSNLPRYLPHALRATMRVPMMTRGAYAPTKAVHRYLNKIFAVSDRIADDLTQRYGIPSDLVEVVYHGVDPAPFVDGLSRKEKWDPVRILYAGRLWDLDKGVFLLPPMMASLKRSGAPVHLTVAGEGPDGAVLRKRFDKAGVMDLVTMTGGLPLEAMTEQYKMADIFVFPSRFEGCGFAVIEAMSAGCAPVVADIRGSLRVLVDCGRYGKVARVGDADAFARAIMELVKDRDELARFQQRAQQRAHEKYSLARMADEYAAGFRTVLASPDRRLPPLSLSDYQIPPAFQPTWRTRIPRPVKNVLRKWMERAGFSS